MTLLGSWKVSPAVWPPDQDQTCLFCNLLTTAFFFCDFFLRQPSHSVRGVAGCHFVRFIQTSFRTSWSEREGGIVFSSFLDLSPSSASPGLDVGVCGPNPLSLSLSLFRSLGLSVYPVHRRCYSMTTPASTTAPTKWNRRRRKKQSNGFLITLLFLCFTSLWKGHRQVNASRCRAASSISKFDWICAEMINEGPLLRCGPLPARFDP